jgi:hypothetical protein
MAVSSGRPTATGRPPRRVEVDIGELVLRGIRPADRHRVAAAFERELTRLLQVHGLPAAEDATRNPMTGLPALPPVTSPRRLGEALARVVHVALSGPAEADRPRPRRSGEQLP